MVSTLIINQPYVTKTLIWDRLVLNQQILVEQITIHLNFVQKKFLSKYCIPCSGIYCSVEKTK